MSKIDVPKKTGPGSADPQPNVSYKVHAFYYPWYCNPERDGRYMHWNHELLPHWDKHVAARFPRGQHDPSRDDLGASFYPQLGPYSSSDLSIMRQHMEMLVAAEIGVAVVSWLPMSKHDQNGPPIAGLLGPLLEVAFECGIKIAVHMEPYEGRSPESMRRDIKELFHAHGNSPALYRVPRPDKDKQRLLPLLYVYDQYRIASDLWKPLLADPPQLRGNSKGNDLSIRGTPLDAVVLALIVDETHWDQFVGEGGFDGGYTYFAANTFTYGSRPASWRGLQQRATSMHKIFIPCVGPGYDDTRVRPWNAENTKERRKGSYFEDEWKAAIESGAGMISVTSFNEWHEGTQIEPAIPMVSRDGWTYRDYEAEGGSLSYLQLNKKWVEIFIAQQERKT